MGQILVNNATGVTSGAITNVATSVALVDASAFPDPGADYYLATFIGFDGNGTEDTWEVVRVTAKSVNTLTIVRAQEGTTGVAWGNNTPIQARITAGSISPPDNVTITGGTINGATTQWGDLTGTPTTLTGYAITDAATFAQGALADSALQDLTSENLGTLSDVVITGTPADNEVLAYDSGGNWINQTPAEAGLATAAQGATADSALQSANLSLGTITSTTVPVNIDAGTDVNLPVATTSLAGLQSAADKTKLDGVATSANNYSHPNHSGDVTSTGDGATVIAADAVTYAKMQNVASDDVLLGNIAGTNQIVAEITPAQIRTMINVADGANAYVHPSDGVDPGAALTGATVFSDITVNAAGHVTGSATRDITLANLGYTGSATANDYTHPNHTGDVTSAGDGATVIANNAVTEAKLSAAVQTKLNQSAPNNFSATTNPTNTDDTPDYEVGSVWINTSTDEAFRCVDATASNAVWINTTLTSDELGTIATQNANSVSITGGSITGTTLDGNISQFTNNTGYITDVTGDDLDALSNVTITGNTAGELLKWNGSAWVNNTLAEANIDPAGTINYTHPSDGGAGYSAAALTGATVFSDFEVNAAGHVSGVTTRALTLANLGYTGSPTANDYTHPNHSGDVTSVNDGATVIANDAVTYAKMQNVSQTNVVLGRDSAGAGNVEEISAAALRTIINVEAGATADQSDAEIETAYNTQVAAASQVEMETGTETAIRRMSPLRVAQAISAQASSGLSVAGTVRTGAFTAVAGNVYQCNMTSAFTATLPISPSAGDEVGFAFVASSDPATNNLTLGRNSEEIENEAADFVWDISSPRYFSVMYFSAAEGWKIKL